MSQTTTTETKSAQAEVEGYLVRRRDSSYPLGPMNSYVPGLRGAALGDGVYADAGGRVTAGEVR
ncbi:MAG: hypothetical protein ACK6EB_23880, partial [Planctomyces sp.]